MLACLKTIGKNHALVWNLNYPWKLIQDKYSQEIEEVLSVIEKKPEEATSLKNQIIYEEEPDEGLSKYHNKFHESKNMMNKEVVKQRKKKKYTEEEIISTYNQAHDKRLIEGPEAFLVKLIRH